jgi:hypothetical protein
MSNFNLTDQTNLFKINYYKKSENMYNSANVLQGRVTKKYDFTGKQRFVSVPLSFSGGVGSGSLPTPNAGDYEGAIIKAKKVYATCEIDREAIKASANDEGAFVRATKETVRKTVESYVRNSSRILWGDGSGVLGNGGASTANVSGAGSTASPYVVELDPDYFKEANFEENDLVNIVTGNTRSTNTGGAAESTNLEIVDVDVDNYRVSLVGTSSRLSTLSGSAGFSATDAIAMQGSYGNDPTGLKSLKDIAKAGSGNLYGIGYQRRWSLYVKDAGGSGISTDKMNNVLLDVEKRVGKTPNLIMASYKQFRKILALLEDQKRYPITPKSKDLKGKMSFSGVQFMSTKGPVGIFVDRFCPDNEVWFLNDKYMEVHHRPGHGWFDDDGTVFLRQSDSDAYGARYGGYYENYLVPTAHGVLEGLA